MKTLIRFVTRNAAGGIEHTDKIVDTPMVTIGRATDQVLQLRDRRTRLQHATIELERDGVHIKSTTLAGIVVNGRSQRDARLGAGDNIEVGANILRVIEPPPGVDIAFTFELSEDATEDHLVADWSETVTGIGGWSKRRLAWTTAVVVLILTLALPALSLLPSLAGTTRNTPLPDDSWWLAGPVHSAHSSTAKECDACHISAFARVPDAACTECHAAARHVAETSATPVLGEMRCASCHLEHNDPPELVKRHQGLCADCHGDLPADAIPEAASDFLDDHPEFKISLLLPAVDVDGNTEWALEHLTMSEAQGAERSNLRFDHSAHLDPDGIVTPDGRRVIECGDCHEPDAGGAGMQPIVMDERCSGCHTLAFDPDFPSRTVPHGDPADVLQALIEYYSARLLGADPDAVEQRVRRPGQRLTRAQRDRVAAEARGRALTVAEDLFERRACATCHEVTKQYGNAELPWHVAPVRLTESFFVHANFTHAAHQTEVTACDSCHAASESTAATDVLIPGIDNCRECHGSGFARRNSGAQTPSTCIMCHSFHFEAKGNYE